MAKPANYRKPLSFAELNALACERCGCTQEHACPGGCSWSSKFAKDGRAVCTTCAPLVRPIRRGRR